MKTIATLIVGVVTSLLLTETSLAGTWTVDDDGKADYNTIQSAIDASVDGDEILINSGVYIESLNTLGKSIWLHALAGSEVVVESVSNARHLTINSGESQYTIIEGMIFDGLTTSGGLAISASSPTFIDCEIRHCFGTNGGGCRVSGGSPTFENCLFYENSGTESGTYGGGSAMNIRSGGSVSIENTVFITILLNDNNQSNGIMVEGGSSLNLSDCVFTGPDGNASFAAFIYNAYSTVIASGCSFDGGDGRSQIHGWSGFTLDNCTFANHVGPNDTPVGAIQLNTGTMVVTNCNFENNNPGCISDYYSTNISVGIFFCGSYEYDIDAPWNDLGGNEFLVDCPEPLFGACCINGEAVELFDDDCERILGEFMGENSDPNQVSCSTSCPEDVTRDGYIDTLDLLEVISAWGTCQ